MTQQTENTTAVEWLIEEIRKFDSGHSKFYSKVAIYNHAYRMEKGQIIKAFDEGQEYEYQYHINSAPKFYSQTYYNETYNK